ncbi:MAG: hypothetical protein Q9187_006748 [Circinaria calcarea]
MLSLLLSLSLSTLGCLAAPSIIPRFTRQVPRAITCPDNFLNVVLNTVVTKEAGWPNTVWNSLESNGVVDWSTLRVLQALLEIMMLTGVQILVGFTQNTLDRSPTYQNPSGQAAATTCSVDQAQIKQCMDPRDVPAALSLITSPNPPEYLVLFNEPDYSYEGYTPLTSPQESAKALAPIFSAKTTTKFLSPAVAFTNTKWLNEFNDACGNCIDKHIPIIAAHIYNKLVDQVMLQITTLHNTWPSKRIWITELAPASSPDQGCDLDAKGVINWMQTLLPQIVALGYVDRVFWNHGESEMVEL